LRRLVRICLAAPAAGLLLQGLLFAPFDLPQYGMNVTTLLVPLWAVSQLAKRIVAPRTAYVDLSYTQALALSTAYQGGVVAWVAFWAFYGQGFGAEKRRGFAPDLDPRHGRRMHVSRGGLHRRHSIPVAGF
jgi:hypothetical protein